MYGPVHNSSVGNAYGTTSGASASSSPFSSYMPGGGSSSDVLSLSGQQGEGESKGFMGKIKDFGKGIFKGAVNTVTSLFSLKGLAMTLGSVALVAIAGPVAIPLLIAGGLAVGGMQVAKGVMSGDWEKAGEGTFTVGATLLGAKMAPNKVTVTKGGTKTSYALTNSKGNPVTGFVDGTIARFKALLPGKGGQVYKKLGADGQLATGADAASTGAFALSKDTAAGAFGSIKSKVGNFRPGGKKSVGTDAPDTAGTSGVSGGDQTHRVSSQSSVSDTASIVSDSSSLSGKSKLVQAATFADDALPLLGTESSGSSTSASVTGSESGGILGPVKKLMPKFDSPSMTGVVLGTSTAAGMGGGLQTAEDEAAAQQAQIYQ